MRTLSQSSDIGVQIESANISTDLMAKNNLESNTKTIKKIEKRVTEENFHHDVVTILLEVRPVWQTEKIHKKALTGGITNKLLSCWESDVDDIILIRIFGSKTDLFIDRELEKQAMQTLSLYGCCPEVYASFENGLCYRFIKGVDLDYKTVRTENIARLICQQMVKMHLVDVSSYCPKVPCLFPKLYNFLSLIPQEYLNGSNNHCLRPQLPSHAILEAEVKYLENQLTMLKSPIVFCHNDLLLKNIIYEEESNLVKFIDLEYASYNYQAFDIGNHFCEFAGVDTVDYSKYPDREFQRNWLHGFLGFWFQAQNRDANEVTTEDVDELYVQVNKFALASHMMWGLWSIVQSIHSTINFDYITYAAIRLAEYFNRKEEFLSLKLPLD